MVQGSPSVRVDVVHVCVTVLNDCFEGVRFLLLDTEDGLVDRSLSKDARPLVNLVTTVHEIPQVLRVGLCRSLIQTLNDIASEFVFSNLERILSESCRPRFGPETNESSGTG